MHKLVPLQADIRAVGTALGNLGGSLSRVSNKTRENQGWIRFHLAKTNRRLERP